MPTLELPSIGNEYVVGVMCFISAACSSPKGVCHNTSRLLVTQLPVID